MVLGIRQNLPFKSPDIIDSSPDEYTFISPVNTALRPGLRVLLQLCLLFALMVRLLIGKFLLDGPNRTEPNFYLVAALTLQLA